MGRIWTMLMLASAVLALVTKTSSQSACAMLASGEQTIRLAMTILASMMLWSGVMEILSDTGDVARLGRVFRRLLKPLFPGLRDEEAWDAMSMNLSANLLGLGNAATPAGIAAARRLAALGETGMRSLAMLLVLDNTSLQLIPTTVMTLRQAAGASDPGDVWGMTLLISGASTVFAAALLSALQRGVKKHGRVDRCGDRRPGGAGCAAGHDSGL